MPYKCFNFLELWFSGKSMKSVFLTLQHEIWFKMLEDEDWKPNIWGFNSIWQSADFKMLFCKDYCNDADPVKNLSSQQTHSKLTLNSQQTDFEDTHLAHSKLTRLAHTVSLLRALCQLATHTVSLLWAILGISRWAHHAVISLWSHCDLTVRNSAEATVSMPGCPLIGA